MLKFARHHPSPTGATKRSSSVDRGTRHSPASMQIILNSASSPTPTQTTTTTATTTTLTRYNRKSLSQEVATTVQRRSRTSSLERVSTKTPSPLSSGSSESSSFTRGISVQPFNAATPITETPSTDNVRRANIVATAYSRSCSPPPPLPQKNLISSFVRHAIKELPEMKQKSQPELQPESNYEAIFSGMLCRGQQQQQQQELSIPVQRVTSLKPNPEATTNLILKGGLKKDFYVNNHLYEPRSDFHRAVVRLVEKMDLQLLDTSSESGYGSDQDSLNNLANMVLSSAEGSTGSSVETSPPPIPSRGSRGQPKEKKAVRFDSYVMLLQGLRERNLDLVRTHVREVCDEALATEEVVNEFLTAVIEGNEPLIREMLANGFNVNSSDPAGMTPLHLAATFNYLPLVRLLLSHGAAVFARTHSSGNVPSELCSRRLPGFQACHAYLRCMEECLGVANKGRVHVTQPYRTCRCDELGVIAGETLTVIRKGDYQGSSWWWCENTQGQQGYVLQDLLALNKPTASIRR